MYIHTHAHTHMHTHIHTHTHAYTRKHTPFSMCVRVNLHSKIQTLSDTQVRTQADPSVLNSRNWVYICFYISEKFVHLHFTCRFKYTCRFQYINTHGCICICKTFSVQTCISDCHVIHVFARMFRYESVLSEWYVHTRYLDIHILAYNHISDLHNHLDTLTQTDVRCRHKKRQRGDDRAHYACNTPFFPYSPPICSRTHRHMHS